MSQYYYYYYNKYTCRGAGSGEIAQLVKHLFANMSSLTSTWQLVLAIPVLSSWEFTDQPAT